MTYPTEFYENQIKKISKKLSKKSQTLNFLSFIRLIVFLVTIYLVYYFSNYELWAFTTAVVGGSFFILLVSVYSNIKYQKNRLSMLLKINETELRAFNQDFSFLETGNEFANEEHYFSNDIDLFGDRSFFQYINRTGTSPGKKLLASILLSNNTADIEAKQEAVKEICDKPEWRQNFLSIAGLINAEVSVDTILSRIENYSPFITKKVARLPLIFSAISIIIIVLTFSGILPVIFLICNFITGLGITGYYLKKTTRLSWFTSKTQNIFEQYSRLIKCIESELFLSGLLKEERSNVFIKAKKASKSIKSFSNAIDALDQRNNIFVGLLGNGFFLWDLIQCYRIERWIKEHKKEIKYWFNCITYFDAYISLGNFAFNHPEYSYPGIVSNEILIDAQDLGHPLIKKGNLVPNNFILNKEKFFIITGANMAGKSTFLRTVSFFIVMANSGLPVNASKSIYSPVKLITSMRTSDSLSKEESYFFSELKRLKYIVEEVGENDYLIILDEILKGTNSKDKAEGSEKFIEKLASTTSAGIIATHDLSLCDLAEKNNKVENYYFDAYIKNDELSFDYKLKPGICKNMNASYLLKKMGVI
ncbi:MutS-related protein [Abyssalbus ytuae]|uniref:DNA mismatch repair protein MutS n=1 Tax=Abyssalbus ytuae TaxID=2926907 RepID=A0A9E7CTZ7_9FLAO|nr:DNA mismatch repair protein MutS [Abyssalbus ytuae]UOB19076.1 DNA mismatch repair protein MutS [Abyssalbus ytuae]